MEALKTKLNNCTPQAPALPLATSHKLLIFIALFVGALYAPIAIPGIGNTAMAVTEQALQAVPSYANPITQEIEDSGQNPSLGQGMAENLVLKTPATLLVDAEGNIFITFRVGLVEESQDLIIQLLGPDGSPDRTLPYTIVENHPGQNTQDIRINVPTVDPVLRISLVSIPMGREVVCFASFAPEGEVAEVPTADIAGEVDDTAIVIQEASDDPVGIADEDRAGVLTFLAIAAGVLVAVVAIAFIVTKARKKTK